MNTENPIYGMRCAIWILTDAWYALTEESSHAATTPDGLEYAIQILEHALRDMEMKRDDKR